MVSKLMELMEEWQRPYKPKTGAYSPLILYGTWAMSFEHFRNDAYCPLFLIVDALELLQAKGIQKD